MCTVRQTVILCSLLTGLAMGCSDPQPRPVFLHPPDELPLGLSLAISDLQHDVQEIMGVRPIVSTDAALACTKGQVHIVLQPDLGLHAQAYEIDDERCADGRRITLSGGSLLSQQWAVYDLLQTLGVRYFHAEQTYYPKDVKWPEGSLTKKQRPFFWNRRLSVHRTHPVELSAPLDPGPIDMAAYQKRWIDWNVKMRTSWVSGWDRSQVGDYAYARGFSRGAGFNLLNAQQGGRPILDPDDPRTEEAQLTAAIDARLSPVRGLPDPVEFGFQFNPSEFTEVDDQDTVRRLTFIADYIGENYPGVSIRTINHGTAGAPTEHYGVRFFDLPQFAPTNLEVKLHTLMFYDLERPADVYGNEDFSHLLSWMRTEAAVRRIHHYPESSWWLTFDLPVPLYLAPVTIDARQHDIDLLADLVAEDSQAPTGVHGHELFTSGQEWGYWLIDYCFARMSWDREFRKEDCYRDLTGVLEQGQAVYEVLVAMQERQVTDMRDPEQVRFLVGSDDETEIAWQAGIEFHPLPPRPGAILNYSDQEVEALLQRSLVPLAQMAVAYSGWTAQLKVLLEAQDEAQAPWLREIIDGAEIFGLRAAHAVQVYQTAIALRAAIAAGDLEAVNAAFEGVASARTLTEAAAAVVRRREADYRYPPELTIDGDEPGTEGAVPNKTIYPYRYLGRTHRLFYWTRPDQQLAALFGEGLDLVKVNRRILEQSSALRVTLVADQVQELLMDYGDGVVETTTLTAHQYSAQGVYDWSLDLRQASGLVHHEDQVAVVERRFVFEKGALEIVAPKGAEIIESLLPGFVVGIGDDSEPFMALGRLDARRTQLAAQGSLLRRPRSGLASSSADLAMTLKDVGDVRVYAASLELLEGSGAEDRRLRIEGELRTGELVDLLVSVGGFEPVGAHEFVAGVLDYTPERLPDVLPFRIEARGAELP